MTNQEFQTALESANNLTELRLLRYKATAPKYVAQIKEKIENTLLGEDWKKFDISVATLKRLTDKTDTNNTGVFNVPKTNNTFKKYSGMALEYYVNSKGGKGETLTVFVKPIP